MICECWSQNAWHPVTAVDETDRYWRVLRLPRESGIVLDSCVPENDKCAKAVRLPRESEIVPETDVE